MNFIGTELNDVIQLLSGHEQCNGFRCANHLLDKKLLLDSSVDLCIP